MSFCVRVRSEVLEFGAVPTAPWLVHLESLQALQELIPRLLLGVDSNDQGSYCECSTRYSNFLYHRSANMRD